MLNIQATSRLARVIVVLTAFVAACAADLLVSGQAMMLRVLVSVVTFVAIGAIGLALAPKRS